MHEFKVAMTCESCSGAVERVLNKHKGEYLFCLVKQYNRTLFSDKIESFDVNLKEQQVKVKSQLSANEILEIIKKTGKSTEHISSS